MVSSALVYDTSIFGVTSPIRGSRYRLQLDQTSGDLRYGSALADYRTYLMPVRPFTIALRGMYYGRFGPDAENPLLTPVFLGYAELVRGYDYRLVPRRGVRRSHRRVLPGVRQAVRIADGSWPTSNCASRLWGAFGGDNFYGPLPVEVGVFTDAGAAWDRSGRC